jgi:hypothetical protein
MGHGVFSEGIGGNIRGVGGRQVLGGRGCLALSVGRAPKINTSDASNAGALSLSFTAVLVETD